MYSLTTSIEWPKSETTNSADSSSCIRNCLVHYKGIYILNDNYNVAFGKIIIPFIKLGLILAFTMAFFAAVRLSENLDGLSLLLVSLISFTYAIVMPTSAIVMSSLYDISKKFSRNLSPAIQLVPRKKIRQILERQMKSCLLIRCQVGNTYHMEAKAKLTMIQNVVNGVVFLLVNVPKETT